MHRLPPLLAAVIVLAAPPAQAELSELSSFGQEDDAVVSAPPAGEFTLADDWSQWWRRIQDRGGRPDPDGPIQQRSAVRLYQEYELNLAIPTFPMRLERAWNQRLSGARLSVQSLNEFELANRVELRTNTRMSKSWRLGVGYDRMENRTHSSDLLAIDFIYDPPGDGGYGAIGFTPRLEKIDTDGALTLGYRHGAYGDARVRVLALDPFNDAAYGLAESRDRVLPVYLDQQDLPLATTLELLSERRAGVRGELYLGAIFPQATRYESDEPTRDHTQEIAGQLAGALVEWSLPTAPVSLGASVLHVKTRWQREHTTRTELDRRVDETTNDVRLYALAAPLAALKLEAQVRWRSRPEQVRVAPGSGMIDSKRTDHEWLSSLRAEWMFGRVAGAEVGLFRLDRETSGPPDLGVEGTAHRLLTRSVLQMGRVWAAWGLSWDIGIAGKGIFGGLNLSLLADF